MNFSRRSILNFGAICAFFGLNPLARSDSDQPPYADSEAADKWIKSWIDKTKSVNGALFLGRFSDRIYFLTKKISWLPNPGQESLPAVHAPAGFVTDMATIPRLFWSLLPTDGPYTYPAIIHDYLYWEQSVTREQADNIFLHAMEDFKIDMVTRNAIYSAVRLGGQGSWNDNAKLKASGENRFIKVYPSDPTTSWAEWKTKKVY